MNQSRGETAISELLDLRGRIALVSGASGGIGAAIAKRLAAAGAALIVHYRSGREAAEETAAHIAAAGGRASIAQADLRSAAEVTRMFADLEAQALCPDCVVNNAALQTVAALPELTLADWQAMLAANLDSAFLLVQAAAGSLRQRQMPGAIVNIASIEGLDPAAGHAHYASSKAGLIMFTRAAALEYGGDRIRVNAVSPGLIDRPGLQVDWPEGVARWQDKAPLAGPGLPNDVADAVLFLLSPAARWISGANLVVDGGMSAVSRW